MAKMNLFLSSGHIVCFLFHGSLYLLHTTAFLLYRTFVWWPFCLAARLLGVRAKEDCSVGFLLKPPSREDPIYALSSRENRWVMDWFGLSELESGVPPTKQSSHSAGKINGKVRIKSDPGLVDMCIPNSEWTSYNGHLHTIIGSFLPFPRIQKSREMVKSYDLNYMCLDFFYPTQKAVENGIYSTDNTDLGRGTLDQNLPTPRAFVLMLPGITGDSEEIYMRRMIAALLKRNMVCCVLNPRGIKDTPLKVPQMYSALFTADIRFALTNYLRGEDIQARLQSPRRVPVFGMGFSMGGVILSNYVGECGKKKTASRLDAAISICAPHDCAASMASMEKLFSRWTYNRILTRRLVAYCKQHTGMVENCYGLDRELLFKGPSPLLHRLRDLRSFDDHITAKHFGFASANEYYAAANNFPRLRLSQTPQMCVIAADDPICGPQKPADWVNLLRAHAGGLVYLELPSGGHLGFVGSPFQTFREQANPMESLVARAICRFADHYEKKQAPVESKVDVCNGQKNAVGHS